MNTDQIIRAQAIAAADFRYREAKRRRDNARGPTAAQAAERSMHKWAAELEALGAAQTKFEGAWK